ncbi:unnamed protein product [Prunus brigantina]
MLFFGEGQLREKWVVFSRDEGEDLWKVKVGGSHRISMWDFVQVAVVVTRVLEIRFGSLRASAGVWNLGRVSSFGRGEGMSALVLVALMLDILG